MFTRDRSITFKDLLEASITSEFGFQKQDILPLFNKYQRNRQILVDIISFLTYVLQLPTLVYLRRLKRSNFVIHPAKSNYKWFKTIGSSNTPKI